MSTDPRTRKVLDILADILGLDPSDLGPDASMESVPQWDSLQHLGFVVALEEEFGCTIPPEDIPELNTVTAIVAWLQDQAPNA